MLSLTKELKNIPISVSLLYDKEYEHLFIMMKSPKQVRRCFSENSIYKHKKIDYVQTRKCLKK
jgi:hypothetical protein